MNAVRTMLVAMLCMLAMSVSAQECIPKYCVDGMFFDELPSRMYGKELKVAVVDDGNYNSMIVIRGAGLSADEAAKAIPAGEVKDAGAWLAKASGRHLDFFSMTLAAPVRLKLGVGDTLRPFSVRDVDGRVWDNKAVGGRPLVINFWHTGCGPCKREMPEISRWIDECPGATFLAVTFDGADAIRPIVEERGFRFVQVAGDKSLWSMFGIREVPVTVLVGRDGKIIKITTGTSEEKRAGMLAAIKAACAGL